MGADAAPAAPAAPALAGAAAEAALAAWAAADAHGEWAPVEWLGAAAAPALVGALRMVPPADETEALRCARAPCSAPHQHRADILCDLYLHVMCNMPNAMRDRLQHCALECRDAECH
jgi:hypothetical protein